MGSTADEGRYRPTEEPEIGRVDETVECVPCGARWTNQTGEPLRRCPSCGRAGQMRLVRLDMYEPVLPSVPKRNGLAEIEGELEEQARRLRSLREDGWELGESVSDGVIHVVRRYERDEVRRIR